MFLTPKKKENLLNLKYEIKKLTDTNLQQEKIIKLKDYQISELKEICEDLENKLTFYENAIKNKNKIIQNSVDLEIYNELYEKHKIQNKMVNNQQINSRGAGRKNKANKEQLEIIMELYRQGNNYNFISRELTNISGEKWNRVTIKNIITREKN